MAVKTGNGQHGGATREQGEDQRRFAQVQERYLKQAEQQAKEVKQELQQANELGSQAVSQYVRALANGCQAFLPPGAIDPRQTIDFATDLVVQTAELQRSFINELISVGQVNAQAWTAEAVSNR